MNADTIRVKEAAARLGCSERKAYEILHKLNDELKEKGYITIAGRVPRSYFEKRCRLDRKVVESC